MLLLTVAIAYGSTVFSGYLAYFTGNAIFPQLIDAGQVDQLQAGPEALTPYFTIAMPPVMGVMTALILAFVLGLGVAHLESTALKNVIIDVKDIISGVIEKVIIPLLPLYILGIFMEMASSGKVVGVLVVFIKIIGVIFVLHIFLLLLQFTIAGLVQGEESDPSAHQYASRLLHGLGYGFVGSDDPRDTCPSEEEWRQRRGWLPSPYLSARRSTSRAVR